MINNKIKKIISILLLLVIMIGIFPIDSINISYANTTNDIKHISIGGKDVIFLKNDGTVWGTGYNDKGLLK